MRVLVADDEIDRLLQRELAYHVVVALDKTSKTGYIITAYQPTLDKFEPDFKTRR